MLVGSARMNYQITFLYKAGAAKPGDQLSEHKALNAVMSVLVVANSLNSYMNIPS